MAGRFIHVDDAFTRHPVNDRHCGLIFRLGDDGIARMNRLNHPLDISAQHGTHAGVVLAVIFGLTGAFLRLNSVSQSQYS